MTSFKRIAKDEPERIVLTNVAEYGWHAVNVIEDCDYPPWSYTIGLFETWNFPELIIIGRSRATSQKMLETLANDVEMNGQPDVNDPEAHLLLGMKCRFVKVLPRYYSDYVGFALWYYRKRRFPLYQVVWPNGDSLYPWHPNAPRTFKEWQPVLSGSSPSCNRDVATD